MAEDPNKPERLKQLEKAQAALNKQYADTERHLRALVKLKKAQGSLTAEQEAEIKELAKSQFALNEEMAKQEDILQEQTKAYEKQAEALRLIEERYAAVSKAAGMFQGALNNIAGAFQQVTGLKIPMTVGDMATEFLGLATKVDTASTSLRRATGFTAKLDGDLIQARKNTYRFGQSWEETSQSLATANSEITLFASLAPKTRYSMMKTITDLEGIGVEAADSAKAMDLLTRGMGMSTSGADKAVLAFDTLAQSVGLPTSQLVKDFAAMGPQLAKFGRRSTVEFRKLTRQARALGLSVQQVFDIGEQFDTFEGAAEVAGTLNAQLGLRLNSVELLNAKEADRIQILRDEFKLRGKSFEQMGRFEMKAIADIMGVDVNIARRMFGTPAELAAYQGEMETLAKRQEKMNTLTDRFQGIMNMLFDKLAQPGGPVDTFLTYMNKILEDFNPESISKWGDTLKTVLIGVAGVMGASLGAALTITIGSIRTITKEIRTLAAAMTQASVINPVGGIDMPDSDGGGGDGLDFDAFFSGGDKDTKSGKGSSTKGGMKPKGFKGKMKGIGGALKGLMKGGLGKGIFSVLKKIPIMGLIAGIGGTATRLMQGDYTGALMQLAAGAASTVPGIGTALSMGIEAADLARGSMQSDFVMRGDKVTPFRKDDIIMGGTSLLDSAGGGAMSSRETKKLAVAIGEEVSKAVTGALKGTQSKTVKLMLNERELGSVVTNIIEEKLSLTTA